MTDQYIGDFPAKLGPHRAEIAQRVALLTFGLSAVSQEGKGTKLPGSGVFIAPYLGLTAKHVVTDVSALHAPRPAYGKEIPISLKLHQVPTFNQADFVTAPIPMWTVRELIECPYSDLALLQAFPDNNAAEEIARLAWKGAMLRLRLLPPLSDARVRAFGFPGLTRALDETGLRLEITSGISFSEGRVTEVFDDWRVPPQPPRPAIFGPLPTHDQTLTDFPCFETTAPVDEGMSGGPVFYGDDLLGIVSAGFKLERNAPDDAARSRAATLWPLLFMRNVPTGLQRVSFLDLLKSALFDCPDWREAERRSYIEEIHGISRIRICRGDSSG